MCDTLNHPPYLYFRIIEDSDLSIVVFIVVRVKKYHPFLDCGGLLFLVDQPFFQ